MWSQPLPSRADCQSGTCNTSGKRPGAPVGPLLEADAAALRIDKSWLASANGPPLANHHPAADVGIIEIRSVNSAPGGILSRLLRHLMATYRRSRSASPLQHPDHSPSSTVAACRRGLPTASTQSSLEGPPYVSFSPLRGPETASPVSRYRTQRPRERIRPPLWAKRS